MRSLKNNPLSIKDFLLYGGIPLIIIASGFGAYLYFSKSQETEKIDQMIEQGKIDQATGSFIDENETRKYVEYQNQKYFVGDDFCQRSKLQRFAIKVKRFNGAASADGTDGNTMYAIETLDNPEYIDSAKGVNPSGLAENYVRDCWKRETKP